MTNAYRAVGWNRQKRVYDDAGRVEMVSYDSNALQENYADPLIYPERLWRDIYKYDDAGRPLGWIRSGDAGFFRFTRHGARVLGDDAQGRPATAEVVAYPVGPARNGRRRVGTTATGAQLLYEYEGPEDARGYAQPVAAPAPPEDG